MPRRRLVWRLFPSYALVALAALFAAGWMAVAQLESSSLNSVRADLQARADFLDSQLGAEIPVRVLLPNLILDRPQPLGDLRRAGIAEHRRDRS